MAKYDLDQFKAKLEKWAKDLPRGVQVGLEKGVQIVSAEAISKHLSGPKMARGMGSSTSGTLQPHTGDLRGSILTKVKLSGSKTSGKVFSQGIKYARIHEYGGQIRRGTGVIEMPERSYLRSSVRAKQQQVMKVILDGVLKEYERS